MLKVYVLAILTFRSCVLRSDRMSIAVAVVDTSVRILVGHWVGALCTVVASKDVFLASTHSRQQFWHLLDICTLQGWHDVIRIIYARVR